MSRPLSVAPVRPSADGPWRAFLRAPISKRTWVGFAFLVVKAPLGLIGFCYTIVLLTFGVGTAITFLGLPLIGLTVLGGRQFGRLHRGIGRAMVGARVADPVRFRSGPGLLGWLRSALRDATGWRALAYLLVSFAVSPVATFAVTVLWAEALVAVFYPAWWAIFDPTNKDAHGVAHHAGLQFGSFFFDTWPKAFLVTAMGLVATFLAPWPIRAVAALDGVLMRWLLGPTKASLRVHERPGVGVLVLSQWVETRYAAELLATSSSGVGYLLKDRVADVGEFVEALTRVAAGGTALDPEVVSQLLGASRRGDVLAGLTPREREVLALMAEGRTNAAIARRLVVTERAVEKHVANIFTKLDLPPSGEDHRRVLAVLRYLDT